MSLETLKISHPLQEGQMLLSRYLTFQVLLDLDEMQHLFQSLGKIYLFNVSEVVSQGEVCLEDFLENYSLYLTSLKNGVAVDRAFHRAFFSLAMTKETSALYAMEVPNGYLIKPILPLIQFRPHHFLFSSETQQFYPMAMGLDSISWGFQVAYPQLYQNSKVHEVEEVLKNPTFFNTSLFKALTAWMRTYTEPTPFLFEGKKYRATFRIGKKCFQWIDRHPQLQQGLKVAIK